MSRILLILVLITVNMACSRFQKFFGRVASGCGIEESSVSTADSYLKILNLDGIEFNAYELENISARYLSASGESLELKATSKGCFKLPKQEGVFQAFSVQGLAYSERFTNTRVHFQTASMEKTVPSEADLICTGQGYFAHQKLDFPLRLGGGAVLEHSKIRLVAKHRQTGAESVLFAKEYGARIREVFKQLDTSTLRDGLYDMRLEAVAILGRWDLSIVPPESRILCPLTIIHDNPRLRGDLELGPDFRSVHKLGAVIDGWSAEGESSELRVCREELGTDEDDVDDGINGACRPKVCNDPEAFRSTEVIRVDSVGVFDYYVYAANRVGLRSEPQCRRVVVSDRKPTLRIHWSEASWNHPMAVMERPAESVSADIYVAHPQLSDKSLVNSLSCKVEFLVDGKAIVPGRNSRCLNATCAGKRLDQFTPCGSRIEISLNDFWREERARPVLMSLRVKGSDGTEQIAEDVKSVWIHPQRWQPEVGPDFQSSFDRETDRFAKDKQGNLYLHTAQSLRRWNRETNLWEAENLPDFIGSSRLIVDGQGELFLVVASNSPESVKSIYQKKEGLWSQIPAPFDLGRCLQKVSSKIPGDGFICAGYDGYLEYRNRMWKEVSWPKQGDGTACNLNSHTLSFQSFAVDSEGTAYRVCEDGSFHQRRPEGEWAILSNEIDPVTSIIADQRGRIWIMQILNFNHDYKLSLWDKRELKSITLPKIISDSNPHLRISDAGRLYFYDYVWDEQETTWKRLAGMEDAGLKKNFQSYPLGSGLVLLQGYSETLLWDAGRVFHYPLKMLGLEVRDHDFSNYTVMPDSDQDLWFIIPARPGESTVSPVRIPVKKYNTFGPEVNLFSASNDFSKAYNFWIDQSGVLTTLVSNRGLVQSSDEGWKYLWEIQDGYLFGGARVGEKDFYVEAVETLRIENGVQVSSIPGNVVTKLGQGRLIVRKVGKREALKIDGKTELDIVLPSEEISMTGTLAYIDGNLFIHYSGVLYQFEPVSGNWERISPESLGWPENSSFPVFSFETKYRNFFLTVEGQLKLGNEQGDFMDFLPISEEFDAQAIGKITEIAQGDFLVMVPSFGIYRGDGRTWTPILSYEKLMKELRLEDRPYLYDMQVDPSGRLWVSGEYFRLLVMEL